MAEEHGERAAELLGDWRAAARDTVAAKAAKHVAELALAAATLAEEAARETEEAARAAFDASTRAQQAAERAKRAAMQAAEAAQLAFSTAEGDDARAGAQVVKAEQAETSARDHYHQAEDRGFPKSR